MSLTDSQLIAGTGIPSNTTIATVNVGGSSVTVSQGVIGSSVGATLTIRDTITIDGDMEGIGKARDAVLAALAEDKP